MPILKAREALDTLARGQVLELTADDPAAEDDLRRWAAGTGHTVLRTERIGFVARILIQKA
jgi:TusA-related sulfurtransferase